MSTWHDPTCFNLSNLSVSGYITANGFDYGLSGVLTMQIYQYYISFPRDATSIKVAIYIVFVAETICTVNFIYTSGKIICELSKIINEMGTTLVINLPADGDVTASSICLHNYQLTLAVCEALVAFLALTMYRIQLITKLNKSHLWVIILVIAVQLFAIATVIRLVFPSLFIVTVIWSSVSLIVDVTITGTVLWFLKGEVVKKKKRNLIIGTGFLTAATNISVLLFLFYSTSYSLGSLIVLSKLYANSMMVLVNNRAEDTIND